jgi:hypothetical protein
MMSHDDFGFMLWFAAIICTAFLGIVVLATLVLP